MINFIKITVCFFLIVSCTKTNLINVDNSKLYNINIDTPSDKYNILLRYELNKSNENDTKKIDLLSIKAEIRFSSENSLSIRGLKPLNILNGVLIYELFDKNEILIHKGKLTSSINYGGVKSLYGKDQNEKYIKERIVKRLAYKLLNRIKIIKNKIEN